MDAKVVVTADKAGNVITRSQNNPDFGHIRVEQTRMLVDDNGFARMKKLSALIPGSIEELQGFGWSANQEVEGKVVVKERLTPFNPKDPERDFKIAGASGIVCTVNGTPIYRKHIFSFDVSAQDTTLDHDNQEEIKSAYAEAKEGSAIKPNEDFNL
jgi:hypothetical protein